MSGPATASDLRHLKVERGTNPTVCLIPSLRSQGLRMKVFLDTIDHVFG